MFMFMFLYKVCINVILVNMATIICVYVCAVVEGINTGKYGNCGKEPFCLCNFFIVKGMHTYKTGGFGS